VALVDQHYHLAVTCDSKKEMKWKIEDKAKSKKGEKPNKNKGIT
jgi:hypothetical protein